MTNMTMNDITDVIYAEELEEPELSEEMLDEISGGICDNFCCHILRAAESRYIEPTISSCRWESYVCGKCGERKYFCYPDGYPAAAVEITEKEYMNCYDPFSGRYYK